ncbi:unnamed protein product, partial [Musa acuminata subsp. burmannicoides]
FFNYCSYLLLFLSWYQSRLPRASSLLAANSSLVLPLCAPTSVPFRYGISSAAHRRPPSSL